MRIAVTGAGPAGTTAALLLARAGHEVTLVDRDGGPPGGGRPWDRVGVMQFNLPHALRAPGRTLLLQRLPDVHQRLLDAGALVSDPERPSDSLLHVRRSVLETVLWTSASDEPGIRRVTGHVDSVAVDSDVAHGVVVNGRLVPADLVVDASGRRAGVSGPLRPPAEGGDCGFAYACRLYQLNPDAAPGPLNGGPGYLAEHHGFILMVFVHDAGTFTVLIVRRSTDRELAVLRNESAFTAAIRAVPVAAEWIDPSRARPIEPVRAGAGLVNRYQAQPAGVRGVLAIGDAACTTNPAGARGLSLGMLSAAALTDIVTESPRACWQAEMASWCSANLQPWFEDHLLWDASLRQRWAGDPVDPEGPIAWDLIAAAARERPELMSGLGPYLAMRAKPAALEPLRAPVRRMLRDGWRPPPSPGPTRDDLVHAVRAMATQPAGVVARHLAATG